ncbi:ribonuclease H-like domain-containing protein [Roseomonas sp. FDAARGOS_362]|uniref:ribonuclease H-like domain-containing protein n=1 Tax=Roseomonas sp. FDAARGOS_362 TaxID=2018065 RepID=UPI000F80BD94|nr:ribonuclease H-like domain-containing protein [Roseomonas sp. FDAARGOS_362]
MRCARIRRPAATCCSIPGPAAASPACPAGSARPVLRHGGRPALSGWWARIPVRRRRTGGLPGLLALEAAEEKRAFEEFMDHAVMAMAASPGARIYHYNHYETTALKRLAQRHATREAELDTLLRGQRFVDLYVIVREALRISEPRYSLKNVERFYRPARDGEVGTAGTASWPSNAGWSFVTRGSWTASRPTTAMTVSPPASCATGCSPAAGKPSLGRVGPG